MTEPSNSGSCHVVVIPYPGRGHINPMMNLCKLISLRRPTNLVIAFVVTEEWFGFLKPEPKPANLRFVTIPNVIPSELNRGADFVGFFNSTQTKMVDPVEQLLRRLDVPISVIMYDAYLIWVSDIGSRMNIPVACVFPMPATVFSMCYYYHLLVEKCHSGDNFSGNIEEIIDYIPGIPPFRVGDLVTIFNGKGKEVRPATLQVVSMATKAQFLLFVSIYELEARVIDALRSELAIPAAIPYFYLNDLSNDQNVPDYIKWLDCQPSGSVLYISQGSFLSVSAAQLEEISAGVHDSGVRYLWIARGETTRFKCKNDKKGLVIPWCDQLRVLCHDSIGAFLSHCGWSSTKEGAFSGVPMLTFPIVFDQVPISKMIVEDWKMGRRVSTREDILVTREEISKLVWSIMDLESEEGKETRKNAKEVEKVCRQATAEGGSAQIDIDSFIVDISKTRINGV